MARKQKSTGMREYVNKRLIGLRSDRSSYWQHWRQLSDYILPRRGRFLFTPNQGNRGDQVGQKIIDSTGTLGVRTLASGLMAGLTSPARPWFRLSLRNASVTDGSFVRLWLDEVQKRILNVLSQSNIYNALHVLYEELSVFGTACILLEEDSEDLVRAQTLTVGEYYLASSGKNTVDTLYREYVLTVRQIVDRFGEDNLSDSVKAFLDSDQLDKEILVAQAIEPNTPDMPQTIATRGKKYRSMIWELGQTKEQFLEIKGYHELPFCAVRWHVTGNDSYGRGPGMDGLGDIKMLQRLQQRAAQAIDKVLNPPMVADATMKNEPASLLPGGVTYVPNLTAQTGFRPAYQVPPDIKGAELKISECQKRIDRVFFVDLFLLISQLDTVRTATEIVERKQEKMLLLGPFLERSQFELINPLIDRVFAIMLRAGLLPPPPREVLGTPLEIQCVSTLADAQKSTATTGIERLVAFVGNLAAARPEVLDNIDFDETVDQYADLLGVTPKLIVSQEQLDRIRGERAKQMQAAQTAQNALAAVQGAQTLSETDVGGGQNALQRMIGAAP